MKKMFAGWTNIKKFLTEIVLTLTTKESRFSQKKILIYVIDLSMLIASLIYMYEHKTTMTAGDHCMIVGMWLAKGTTNVIMTQGDKKLEDKDGDDEDKDKKTDDDKK